MTVDPILSPEAGSTLLPRQVTDMIFEDVARTSIVQQLARRIPLPSSGVAIPITTGKPTAGWVAEGDRKPVSDGTVGTKLMDPKKLATIIVFSEEYLRNDLVGLFTVIRDQIREAFADAFDAAAIRGESTPFTSYLTETTKSVEIGTGTDLYADFIDGLTQLVTDRKRLTGFAIDPMLEPTILDTRDGNERPIWIDPSSGQGGQLGRLLGRPAGYGEGVGGTGASTLRAVGGDWSKCSYGVGREISYTVSREASIEMTPGDSSTLVHLWQDNLVGLRAEAEYGFVVGDIDAFVEYTDGGGAS